MSAGVKGARVGVNAKGKKYLHVGRGGIYYRKTLEDPLDAAENGPGVRLGWSGIFLILTALAVVYSLFAL